MPVQLDDRQRVAWGGLPLTRMNIELLQQLGQGLVPLSAASAIFALYPAVWFLLVSSLLLLFSGRLASPIRAGSSLKGESEIPGPPLNWPASALGRCDVKRNIITNPPGVDFVELRHEREPMTRGPLYRPEPLAASPSRRIYGALSANSRGDTRTGKT